MAPARRPNFLLVVAHDLGYTDTGPYGGEIDTPTLDRLAAEGVLLTAFHTAAACSPTRAMLMSGTDSHIVGLSQLAEDIKLNRHYQGRPGFESYLNHRVAALPELLQDAGYHTIMSGKWHLGTKAHLSPHARGFDKSFVYLAGSGNHFNDEPQLGDFVDYLYRHPAVDSEGLWMRDGNFLDRKRDLPSGFYSTTTFTDELLQYLDGRNQQEREKPFFGYLSFTAPHWPLQAPKEIIEKYKDRYNEGPEILRAKRLQSLMEHGLVPRGVGTSPRPPLAASPAANPAWEAMPEQDRRISSRCMETYAAMVDVIDQNLGRVVEALERSGELDDTFILFMSDNGAEGRMLEALPVTAGVPLEHIIKTFYDNSVQNIGNADSFVYYGPRWASAAAAPIPASSVSLARGGLKSPCIIRYPSITVPKMPGGAVSHDFTTVMDILPTILDLAGVSPPVAHYRQRAIAALRGRSWIPHLRGLTPTVHENGCQDLSGWELFGRRAVRRGKWKAVFAPAPEGSNSWELYDVLRDPAEANNLSLQEPEVLSQLLMEWEKYYSETGLYDPGVEANRLIIK
ncbi:putative arylsulfatase [Microdochium trichocladiopsis]|uniref:Arylsulfatase n=1 Tax=Microdochium trichocladiopsis TaxID=1682393 RepID=A0A9P8Y811_9PEZI|nr:putative arylsulfatase [Microdochium trichocladiopsis]KAH7034624.1 putative arylsulfatase [Microdochium trichocladiopsis]